jgi:hypothetical protein
LNTDSDPTDPDPKPCLLVVDTPPGTSDEHIAVMEALKGVPVDGAVLVTTPQVLKHILDSSVPDPDPYVFGPPGSGSISTKYRYRSGSFYIIKQK